jgi:hypothetical protein
VQDVNVLLSAPSSLLSVDPASSPPSIEVHIIVDTHLAEMVVVLVLRKVRGVSSSYEILRSWSIRLLLTTKQLRLEVDILPIFCFKRA